MKILTICIPCYNNQTILKGVIETYLFAKDDIEIIIIIDNQSTDNTLKIAKDYQNNYQDTIKVIYNESSNHGATINSAIGVATGLYFKVINPNDYLNREALIKALKTLKDLIRIQSNLDLMICDYEYINKQMKKVKRVNYKNIFPLDKVFQWHQLRYTKTNQTLKFEAIIVKTNILKTKNIQIATFHSYIEDMIILQLLPHVTSMYYLNVSLQYTNLEYQEEYYNIDDCINANRVMINAYDSGLLKSRKQRLYISKHMTLLLASTMALLTKQNDIEAKVKRDELWSYLQINNQQLYKVIKKSILGKLINSDNKVTNKLVEKGYKLEARFTNANLKQ